MHDQLNSYSKSKSDMIWKLIFTGMSLELMGSTHLYNKAVSAILGLGNIVDLPWNGIQVIFYS